MVQILHINLKPRGKEEAEFRFFWENSHEYAPRNLSLADIASLSDRAETDYYTRMPVDYAQTGQVLFNWLDGRDRLLQSVLDRHKREQIVLAIATSGRLANLPWELLHDGKRFLVNRKPAIVPVRWVADRERLSAENNPQNRFLNVLFMATSPREVTPKLDFEAEEGQILTATKGKKSLCLTVEESGCLQGLGELVDETEEPFDVVHLTGHAAIADKQPYFLTENEFGDRVESSPEDIATVLQFAYPKLIFLSGCRTGYSSGDAVPSMAEALLNEGATAVLSWGDRVNDDNASAIAAKLYEALSTGRTVTEAIALTYQTLLKQEETRTGIQEISQGRGGSQWHLLRFYVADALPGALVTKPTAKGRIPAPRPTVTDRFIDSKNRLRLLSRGEFVGRRRQLQNCLRVLKKDEEKIGVVLCGMGGWGKSAIAARLCDRLSNYETLVWWRQIDEGSLTTTLGDKLAREEREILKDFADELKFRLRDVFASLNEAGEKPFLFVFDDFEWNLEPREDRYILQTYAIKVLSSLIWAIRETDSRHRIIITCRYWFDWDWSHLFFVQNLDNFHDTDLLKKLRRLENFNSEAIDEKLKERALILADGNPRLLEWLDRDVLSQEDAEEKLTEYETRSDRWQDRIIWNQENTPRLQIDKSLEKILSRCLVYEIPVPIAALEAVCEGISRYREQLQRAIALGLLEVSSEFEECDRVYRVSRILPRIISSIQLPGDLNKFSSLHCKAWEGLTQCWGNQENSNEKQWQEIFRLKFADKNNSECFREGFFQMLTVQSNIGADRGFEIELRQTKNEIQQDNLYEKLEVLLKQDKWKEADEETAWVFYQIMVLETRCDFYDLCQNFPSSELNIIDHLWVKYSDKKFGFSVQKELWESILKQSDSEHKRLRKAGKRTKSREHVKYFDGINWKEWEGGKYENLHFSTEVLTKGDLPEKWITRNSGGGWNCFRLDWRGMGLMISSLLSHQDLTYKI